MISVSLSESQNKDLEAEAKKQDRKVGNLARLFIVKCLREAGYQALEEAPIDGD
jgi:hypothetical protein